MILKITQEEMRKNVADMLNSGEKWLIELGCSDGNFASIIRNRGIKNYLGIDIQQNKIDEAKRKLPDMTFICCDITKNLGILEGASTFVSFQCLEHIERDLDVIKAINQGTRCIISVPNSKYPGHVRWFELDGWSKRF